MKAAINHTVDISKQGLTLHQEKKKDKNKISISEELLKKKQTDLFTFERKLPKTPAGVAEVNDGTNCLNRLQNIFSTVHKYLRSFTHI